MASSTLRLSRTGEVHTVHSMLESSAPNAPGYENVLRREDSVRRPHSQPRSTIWRLLTPKTLADARSHTKQGEDQSPAVDDGHRFSPFFKANKNIKVYVGWPFLPGAAGVRRTPMKSWAPLTFRGLLTEAQTICSGADTHKGGGRRRAKGPVSGHPTNHTGIGRSERERWLPKHLHCIQGCEFHLCPRWGCCQ